MDDFDALVEALRSGDPDAFRTLVRELADPLHRYIESKTRDAALAQDIVQSAFVRLYGSRKRIPPGCAMRGYCFRIALNLLRDARRDALLRERREREAAAVTGGRHEADGERHALAREAWAAVGELPQHLRETIELRFACGLNLRETAEALGAPLSTVDGRQQKALELLRGRLGALSLAPALAAPGALEKLLADTASGGNAVLPSIAGGIQTASVADSIEAVVMASIGTKSAKGALAALILLLLIGGIGVAVMGSVQGWFGGDGGGSTQANPALTQGVGRGGEGGRSGDIEGIRSGSAGRSDAARPDDDTGSHGRTPHGGEHEAATNAAGSPGAHGASGTTEDKQVGGTSAAGKPAIVFIGRVMDTAARPMSRATVALVKQDSNSGAESTVASILTGADGTYFLRVDMALFEGWTPRQLERTSIEVSAEHCARVSQWGGRIEPGDLMASKDVIKHLETTVLCRTGTIFGQVVEADGVTGVAGVQVAASTSSWGSGDPFKPLGPVTTDADGRFRIDGLGTNATSFTVGLRPALPGASVEGVRVLAGRETGPVTIRLPHARTLTFVAELEDGSPLTAPAVVCFAAGDKHGVENAARDTAWLNDPQQRERRGASLTWPYVPVLPDGEGRCRAAGAYAQCAWAAVWSEGFLPAIITLSASHDSKEIDGGTVIMRAAASVAGRVLDEAGAPIAEASVSAGGIQCLWTETDADGAFTLNGISPGKLTLTAHAVGYLAGNTEADTASNAPCTLTLRRGASLNVALTLASGRTPSWLDSGSYPQVRILATGATPRDSESGAWNGWNGPDNPYWLAPGGYIVEARWRSCVATSNSVALEPGENKRVAIELSGSVLRGRVMATGGGPAPAGIRLGLLDTGKIDPDSFDVRDPATCATDSTGAFSFEGLVPGTYTLSSIHFPQSFSVDIKDGVPETEYTVDLSPYAMVRARARIGGTICSYVSLVPTGEKPDTSVRCEDNPDYFAVFLGLSPGRYALHYSRYGGHVNEEIEIAKASDALVFDRDFELASVSGRVLLPASLSPGAYAQTRVWLRSFNRAWECTPDAAGQYSFEDIGPGKYLVQATLPGYSSEVPGYSSQVTEAVVAANQATRQDVSLEPAGLIALKLSMPGGGPPPGTIQVDGVRFSRSGKKFEWADSWDLKADAGSELNLQTGNIDVTLNRASTIAIPVPPGRYQGVLMWDCAIRTSDADLLPSRYEGPGYLFDVTIVAGETATVELELERLAALTIVSPDEKRLDELSFSIVRADGTTKKLRGWRDNSELQFGVVPAGEVTLIIEGHSREPVRRALTLEAFKTTILDLNAVLGEK